MARRPEREQVIEADPNLADNLHQKQNELANCRNDGVALGKKVADLDTEIVHLKNRLQDLRSESMKKKPVAFHDDEDLRGLNRNELQKEYRNLVERYDKNYDFKKHPNYVFKPVWRMLVSLQGLLSSTIP